MLKKTLIFVFVFAVFTTFAEECNTQNTTLFDLQRIFDADNDTIKACRRDPLRLLPLHASFTYKWNDNANIQTPYYVFPSTGNIAGKIWVETHDPINNCTRRDTIVIDTFPAPTIINKITSIGKRWIDTVLCVDDTLWLTVAEVEHVNDFNWRIAEIPGIDGALGNDSKQEVIFNESKLNSRLIHYIVTYIGSGNCIRDPAWFFTHNIRDTVAAVFFAKPPVVDLGRDTTLCDDGTGHELMALSDDPTDGFLLSMYEFRWNNNNRHNQNMFTVNYDNRGIQFVEVWHTFCRKSDSILYTATDTIDIDFWPHQWTEPFRLVRDTGVCERITVTLDATAELPNRTTYHWSVDSTRITDPVRIVSVGNYTVRLRDSAGCERTFTVNVRDENCDPSISMPNVFTPNNDGVNYFFRPITLEKVRNFRLRIYNRWGREVYDFSGDPDDPSWQGWNGNNGNVQAPEGVYFWVVKYDDLFDRQHQLRGTVTLLR